MKLFDTESPKERITRWKGGLKLSFFSGIVVLILFFSIRHIFAIEGKLGGFFSLAALIVGLGALHGIVLGILDAALPPFSRALSFLIGLVCMSIIAFYVIFPDGYGEAK